MSDTEIVETVFDPTKVETKDNKNVRLDWGTWVTKDVHDVATNHFGFILMWQRDWDKPADHEDNTRPAWADFDVKDRIWREVDISLANRMTSTNLGNWKQLGLNITLPCPPYEYELDGIHLTMKSGPYSITGTKPEWESVIQEMEREVEEMPEGVDISDQYVRATGSVTVQFSVNVPVTELLDGDDELDGDMWLGTEEDMQERACEVFEENASEHIDSDDLDMSYGFDDVYVGESYVD